jgi:hypothetical protein
LRRTRRCRSFHASCSAAMTGQHTVFAIGLDSSLSIEADTISPSCSWGPVHRPCGISVWICLHQLSRAAKSVATSNLKKIRSVPEMVMRVPLIYGVTRGREPDERGVTGVNTSIPLGKPMRMPLRTEIVLNNSGGYIGEPERKQRPDRDDYRPVTSRNGGTRSSMPKASGAIALAGS